MTSEKEKPSPASRVRGMIAALGFIIIGLWMGFNAQQMGQELIMFAAFGMVALCFLLCLGIASGKVTPATYMGTSDM